jgi:glycosyltransferase involved in cell wall biosynthesis
MISIVVPTRDRARTLKVVARSYFEQALVDEIIFVSDAGSDNTQDVVSEIGRGFPHVSLKFVRNSQRKGASLSRNIGANLALNKYILFVDDDEYLEDNYAAICMEKLLKLNAGAVSGRRVYMIGDETPELALKRFGTGLRSAPRFRPLICEYVNGAQFQGDVEQPITNAIILTTRELLAQYPYDGFYARGNGYREETDYQMNLFVNNHTIVVTNDVHSFHLPLSSVVSGGQRTSKLRKIYWSIYYTNYFFGKYFQRYAARIGLKFPKWVAMLAFSIFAIYRELVRPPLYNTLINLQRAYRARLSPTPAG